MHEVNEGTAINTKQRNHYDTMEYETIRKKIAIRYVYSVYKIIFHPH